MTDLSKIFELFFSVMIHCLLDKYFFAVFVSVLFLDTTEHVQYDMAMTVIVSCLLAIYLSIFNSFGSIIAVFFTLLYYKVSNNYFTYFFHSPNGFSKGIFHGINTPDNSINIAKGTASEASIDANGNNLNKILFHSSQVSLVAATKNIFMQCLFLFQLLQTSCILDYVFHLTHKLDGMRCSFNVLKSKHSNLTE